MRKYLVIRADASEKIGAGHLMRCLALGQAWKDAGGKTIFITACKNDNLLKRLREENFCIHSIPEPYPEKSDWNLTKNVINNYPNAWVVLDGYHFDSTYQKWIKETEHQLLVIDDMAHLKHYYADILLNQNLHAYELNYYCEPYTKLLLGTKYVLLRRKFLKWKGWKRKIPQIASKLLVTLGGSDPNNATLKVIKALQHVKGGRFDAVIVLGATNMHHKELKVAVHNSQLPIRLENNVTNMPELMAWADVAVSSSGCTCWELAFMGLPFFVLILAENQRPVAERLDKIGVSLNLGWYENISLHEIAQEISKLVVTVARRSRMAQIGKELVDGRGPARIINCTKKR